MFHTAGSVLGKKGKRKGHALTEGKMQDTDTELDLSSKNLCST
jgi:hypothetical protein